MCHNLQPEIARRKAARWHKFFSIVDVLRASGPETWSPMKAS